MALLSNDQPPPFRDVANQLRADILTGKRAPGERLPSQMELSKQFGVSRMTIQQALRILKAEGLTTSRQGSGVFVRERTARPVGVRAHIEDAFRSDSVSIDFAGYTGETLAGAVLGPLDLIRAGKLTPRSVSIRLLLPDTHAPLAVPVRTDLDVAASQPLRDRLTQLADDSLTSLRKSISELTEFGLIPRATVEARFHQAAPFSKTFIINRREVFFGYYPIIQRELQIEGDQLRFYDVMGKDATMVHFEADQDPMSQASSMVEGTCKWFDDIWSTVAVSK